MTHLNEADTQIAQKLLDLWTSFAANNRPRTRFDKNFAWPHFVSGSNQKEKYCLGCSRISIPGKMGPYVRIDKKLAIENDYPKEFVRNISEKKETDYKPLIAMLMN